MWGGTIAPSKYVKKGHASCPLRDVHTIKGATGAITFQVEFN